MCQTNFAEKQDVEDLVKHPEYVGSAAEEAPLPVSFYIVSAQKGLHGFAARFSEETNGAGISDKSHHGFLEGENRISRAKPKVTGGNHAKTGTEAVTMNGCDHRLSALLDTTDGTLQLIDLLKKLSFDAAHLLFFHYLGNIRCHIFKINF